MSGSSLYITHEIPGAGGQIKQTADDFLVEEIPLYEPRGEGVHTYLDVQKRGIPTFEGGGSPWAAFRRQSARHRATPA